MSLKRSFVFLRIFLSLLIFSIPFLILEPSVFASLDSQETVYSSTNFLVPQIYGNTLTLQQSISINYMRIVKNDGTLVHEIIPGATWGSNDLEDETIQIVTESPTSFYAFGYNVQRISIVFDSGYIPRNIADVSIIGYGQVEYFNILAWCIEGNKLDIYFSKPSYSHPTLVISLTPIRTGEGKLAQTFKCPDNFGLYLPIEWSNDRYVEFSNYVASYQLYHQLLRVTQQFDDSNEQVLKLRTLLSQIKTDLDNLYDKTSSIDLYFRQFFPYFLDCLNYVKSISEQYPTLVSSVTSIESYLRQLADDSLFGESISMGYPKYFQQLSDNTWKSYSSSTGKVSAHGVKYSFSRNLTSDVAFGNMIRLSVNYNYINIDSSTLKCFFGGTPYQMLECSLVAIVPSVLEGYKTDFYFVLPTQFTIPYHPQQVYYVGFTYNDGASFQVTTDLIGSISFVKFGSEFYFNNANQQNIISLLNTISNQLNDVQIDISTLTESLNEFNSVTSQLSSYETSYKTDLDSGMSQINLSDYTLGFSTLPISTFTSFVSNCYNSIPYLIRQLIFLPLIFGVVGAFLRRRGGD